MLTPAISDSSTSRPDIIIANAVSTQVLSPPFLCSLPLAEAMMAGFTGFFAATAGACANDGAAAAAAIPAVLVTTNSRRDILSVISQYLETAASTVQVCGRAR